MYTAALKPVKKAYKELTAFYKHTGLEKEEISFLAVFDVKEKHYFSERGVSNQRGGGGLFAENEEIMG